MKYPRLLRVLLSLSLSASIAHAAPEAANSAQASNHFQKGVQLYKQRSFDAALAEFEKAYQLSPDYHLLFNVAQVQLERHDYVAALKRFREYLREGDTQIDAERRAQVEQEMSRLTELVAELRIAASPEGAEVTIDGESVGVLPLAGPLLLNAGIHRVLVSKPGYSTFQQALTVAGGDTPRLNVELRPTSSESPAAASAPAPLARSETAAPPREKPPAPAASRTGLWMSAGATVLFGGAAAGMGLVTRQAKRDFDKDLDTFGSSSAAIASHRSELKRDALITDVLAGAAVVSAGICVYFLVSGPTREESEAPRYSLMLSPGGRGVYARAEF